MTPVFKCAVLAGNEKGGYANAVLIDRDKGIFVTNAHVVNAYNKHRTNRIYIRLPLSEKFVQAESRPEWLNWDADLAYIRVRDDLSAYPQAILRHIKGNGCEDVWIKGYFKAEDPLLTEKGHVASWRSGIGVTLTMLQELLAAQERWLFLEKAERSLLYTDYIHVWMQEGSSLKPSMSGSPLLDKEGRVMGIISRGGRHSALCIPASDIDFNWPLDKPVSRLSRLFNRLGFGKTAAENEIPKTRPAVKSPHP